MEEAVKNSLDPDDYVPPYAWDLKKLPHRTRDIVHYSKLHANILDAIGCTPLVKLNRIPQSEGVKCEMYAKCEYQNPGGSVKDRIGYRMVLDAERDGIISLDKKSVLIESTSGNTGIGLALAATVRGYRCIIVMDEKASDEKANTMLALGAELVRTPAGVKTTDPRSSIMTALRMCQEIPNAVMLNQFMNPSNPLAHYDGIGEEILWSLDGRVDMLVGGCGTGGTLSGVSHKIKEHCPDCLVIAADPYGSGLGIPAADNHLEVTAYEVEGIGEDFIPKVLDRGIVQRWFKTQDKRALDIGRRMIREEGLLCGGSSGTAMAAALEAAKGLREGQRCVVLLPDGIRNYMTKFVTDPWMEARRFLPVPERLDLSWWHLPATKLPLVVPLTIAHSEFCSDALGVLKGNKLVALPVLNDKKSVIGVFTADGMRQRIANHGASAADPVDKMLVKKFYKAEVGGATLGYLSRVLDITPFVLLVSSADNSEKKTILTPVGFVDSAMLMNFVTKQKNKDRIAL